MNHKVKKPHVHVEWLYAYLNDWKYSWIISLKWRTVHPKKYAHGFCFAVLCCVYTLTDFPISIRLTSLALWQSNDCPSASKATMMNMDKYFMWIHYERLHNHNKAKHNKTVCIFLGIYCNDESDGVSNHQPHDSWTNRLFNAQIKENSKLRITGLCEGNSLMTGEFTAQRASNADDVSILWRHHVERDQ